MSARIAAARPPVRSMEATVSAAWAALSRLIDDNGSAGGGERLGDGAADAAGGAGDDGDLSAREWERVGIIFGRL